MNQHLADSNPSTCVQPQGLPLDRAMERYIAATVQSCDGNKTEAARRLGVGRNTVARSLKK